MLGEEKEKCYELLEFVKECYRSWDCDEDAHKYNTLCRSCEAEKLYFKYKKG